MATYLVMRRMFCGVCFLLGADGPRQLSLLPVTVLLRMRSAWAGYAQLFLQACRVGEDMRGPSAGGVTVRRGAVTPLVAARVALPTWRPVARLVASLPPSVAPLFADSAAGLLDPSPSPATVAAALRPKRAFGSPLELEAFYRRALAGGFARGIRPEEVVRARVGIFCVAKDADEDRLILDCSAMNALFLLPDSLRLALPTPADLAAIELPPVGASPIFVSKEDLSSFYYSVSLEPWLHVFFVLPRLPAAAMARLGVEDVLWTAGVMGFKPMVGAATLAHRHLKAPVEAGCAILPVPRPPLVLREAPSGTAVGTYIDDTMRFSTSASLSRALIARTQALYDAAGWRTSAKKAVAPTEEPTTMLGLCVDPRARRIAPDPERLVALLADTRALLVAPFVSPQELEHLLGKWVWLLLLVRPLFSVLSAVYCFGGVSRHALRLWPTIRQELQALVDLAPFLAVNLAAPWAPLVVASDASELGCGVAYSRVAPSVAREWSSALGPFAPESALVHGGSPPSPVVRALADVPWSVAVSHAWRYTPAHIGALEGDAYAVALRWAARMPAAHGSRLLCLLDSMAFGGAARKGRSSTASFRRQLRAGAAWSLVGDFRAVHRWVPTSVMPADAASRLFRTPRAFMVRVGAKGGDGSKGDGPWVSLGAPVVDLVFDVLAASSKDRYRAALLQLAAFLRVDCFVVWAVSPAPTFWVASTEELDTLLIGYLQYLSRSALPLSRLVRAFWALRKFNPWLPAASLPMSFAAVRATKRLAASARRSASPISLHLLLFVVASGLASRGHVVHASRIAVACLVAFDCLLRSAEVLRLERRDILFPVNGGLPTLVLRDAKTGKGLAQTVRVRRPWVAELLRGLCDAAPASSTRLFPFAASSWRAWFAVAIQTAGLASVGRFTLHSFRHGGATELFLRNVPIPRIMLIGRWESERSFRVYVKQWNLLLLQLDEFAAVALLGRRCRRSLVRFLLYCATQSNPL